MDKTTQQRLRGDQTPYDQLRQEIISGELPASTALSEPELSKKLGVSRTPIREALAKLISDGLAVKLASNRTIVAPIGINEVRNIYAVRERLEGLIAYEATKRLTELYLDSLKRKVEFMKRISDDQVEILRLGKDFHSELELIAANESCSLLLRIVRTHIDRYRALATSIPGRSENAVIEHEQVLLAIESGKPETAERVMREHISAAGDAALKWLEKNLVI